MDHSAKRSSLNDRRRLDVASAAHELGSQLQRFRLDVLGLSQEKMAERLSSRLSVAGRERGISESTYRKMESGDPTVNFTYWLAAFQEFGSLEDVIKAAEPATEAFHAMVNAVPGYEEITLEGDGTYGR